MVGKVLEKTGNYGFDARDTRPTWTWSRPASSILPEVVLTALQDAASVAALLITTEAMIAEKPKDKPAMGGGIDFKVHPPYTEKHGTPARERRGFRMEPRKRHLEL